MQVNGNIRSDNAGDHKPGSKGAFSNVVDRARHPQAGAHSYSGHSGTSCPCPWPSSLELSRSQHAQASGPTSATKLRSLKQLIVIDGKVIVGIEN